MCASCLCFTIHKNFPEEIIMNKRIVLLRVLSAIFLTVRALSLAGESAVQSDISGVIRINLGGYARGDGSDETESIQKAFDMFNAKQPEYKNCEHRLQKGVRITGGQLVIRNSALGK